MFRAINVHELHDIITEQIELGFTLHSQRRESK